MRLFAALAFVLFAACSSDPAGPPAPAPSGTYFLTTDLEVPAGALLPQPGYDALAELHGLRDDPGETMFDLLDHAGVPLVEDLEDLLPDVLQSRVEGWIGDAIHAAIDRTALDALLTQIDAVIADVDIVSELETDGLTAVHRVIALRFVDGLEIETSALAGPPVVESATTVEQRDGRLIVGTHAFGVPFGGYAWRAVEARLPDGSLRASLGEVVDCAEAAAEVAGRGAFGVTVGHATEIQAICEAGLDLVAEKAAARVLALDWDALAFAQGDAALVDLDGDQDIDAVADGVWDATIDVGQGARDVGAKFLGTR